MAQTPNLRRKFGRFEYDPVTGTYVLAAVVLAVVVLGALALSDRGSPRMDDGAAALRGVTTARPSATPPAATENEVAR
jgi:hypothetical protein